MTTWLPALLNMLPSVIFIGLIVWFGSWLWNDF